MKEQSGPVYEVTLSIDREVAGDIDHWLAVHVEEMLLIPGFIRARTFALDDEQDRVRRVTHYYLENDAVLEQYFTDSAAGMRQAAIEKFGDRFDASRRILHETNTGSLDSDQIEICLNCNTTLAGQYCANCGQRARSRLISVWELLRDAFGDLLEFDSRVWQTLIPLAVRPGQLTRDYLRGRRARFMPPFRTYLVLSVLFFLVAFFDPQESLSILFEPEAASPEQIEKDHDLSEEVLQKLAGDSVVTGPLAAGQAESESSDRADPGHPDVQCNFDDYDEAEMPAWLARRLTRERLQIMCDRMTAEDGRDLKGFLDKLLENVPAGLFLLLPLMALILSILYPLSKRYYVEHLLFVIHYHAFIFLALLAQILWVRLTTLIGLPELVINVVFIVLPIYIGAYLYKAMRRVYEQGRWVTALKFIILLVTYTVGLSLILLTAALFAAFSI